MLSVLLATVSARCASVREGSDLVLEHEDAGCSRWADRAGGSHPSRRDGGLARCTGGGVASSAASALRGAVQFRRGMLNYGRKRRCRGAARARGGRLLARRGHVVRRVACPLRKRTFAKKDSTPHSSGPGPCKLKMQAIILHGKPVHHVRRP